MSTNPSLPNTPKSKEDADYNKICEEYQRLIETLPKDKGWATQHLYNYKGFWLHDYAIKNNLFLHTYFKSQSTDIFLASYMKSGTNWLIALMFSTINRHRYSFSDHPLHHRPPISLIPLLDRQSYLIPDHTHIPAPRIFATHFPPTLLPPSITTCKFVYICREPKDVLISKWNFLSKLRSKDLPPLTLDDAFKLFCQGISQSGPFWEHVLSYWRASLESPDKILFLKYEELKKQPEVVLIKLAAFMGKPFMVEEMEKGVVENIVKLCSFKNLSNLDVNKEGADILEKTTTYNHYFFRKGEVGDWKNHLTEDMKQHIDNITHEKLKGSGLILGASA